MRRQDVIASKNQAAARLRKKTIKTSHEENAKAKPKPKRRRPQKKKELEDEPKKKRHQASANGTHEDPKLLHSKLSMDSNKSPKQPKQFGAFRTGIDHEKKKIYERAPRLLPPIDGVKALNNSEVQRDLKQINTLLTSFEAHKAALLPPDVHFPSGLYVDGNNQTWENIYVEQYGDQEEDNAAREFQLSPETLVESLPKCRRAVHMTQRELMALKHEYEDLERNYMRLRCKYIWQLRELKRLQHQQRRVLRTLHRQVEVKAKELESSRRRTSALQDLMNELEERGNRTLQLSRERDFFKRELMARIDPTTDDAMPVFDPDEIQIGDPVVTPFGKGCVQSKNPVTEELQVGALASLRHDRQAVAFVHEDDAVLMDWEVTYDREERKLKQSFFEKLGAVIHSNELLANGNGHGSMDYMSSSSSSLVAGSSFSRLTRRPSSGSNGGSASAAAAAAAASTITGGGIGAGDFGLPSDESEWSDDDDDDEYSSDASASDQTGLYSSQQEQQQQIDKLTKRRLRHAQRSAKLIDFTACSIPIVPRGIAQLVSPLSELPEKTSALGPQSLQWMTSYLPQKMVEWEHERYESLELKAEIERLRFLLQKAESEKVEAQQHAADQVDSMNQLVIQLEKLRESVHSNNNNVATCLCAAENAGDKNKKPATKAGSAKVRGKANNHHHNNNRKNAPADDENDQELQEQEEDTSNHSADAIHEEEEDETTPVSTRTPPHPSPASQTTADKDDQLRSNSNSPVRTTTRRSLRRRRAVKSSPHTKR